LRDKVLVAVLAFDEDDGRSKPKEFGVLTESTPAREEKKSPIETRSSRLSCVSIMSGAAMSFEETVWQSHSHNRWNMRI